MTTTLPELRFDSKPENIAVVEKLIDKISADHGIVAEHYGNVLIAMTEGVNNAIVHGNKLQDDKTVVVEYELQARNLYFKITDQGAGFDFENVPDPTSPENIEKPNGRGVFLMRSLADECTFEDDGRIVELTFNDVFAAS